MLFNSLQFLLFFPLVVALYFALPHRYRWFHLLVASCLFYAAFIPAYLLILWLTIAVDYYAGLMIAGAEGRRRRNFLILSIVVNVGILGLFKYYNFFADNINALGNLLHAGSLVPLLHWVLPIGLSFHTFQAMSYTIEVYRGTQEPERHFGYYALYVMFFPQLVAGPIERPNNMLHQFHEPHRFDSYQTVSGLRLMLWGFFKKTVIADRLALLTDPVFNDPQHQTPLALLFATVFFSFQIFCDFSGYSDIALGSARVMGFRLMRNFDRPYQAASIAAFWKRWHISLSTWFRDYLYIPLGGNRVAPLRRYANLLAVFIVSGFWHGANWTFLVWGGLHGLFQIAGILWQRIPGWPSLQRTGIVRLLSVAGTFLLVTFAWIFFRAHSLADAGYIIGRIPDAFGGLPALADLLADRERLHPDFGATELMLSLAFIVVMETVHLVQSRIALTPMFERWPLPLRWSAYYAVLFLIVMLGVFQQRNFIYFQF